MAQIQESVIELNNRNTISRVFHAKSDHDAVVGWNSDLNRILQIFNVRSTVLSLDTLLTTHFQTELALHVDAAVSNVHHDVANTRGLVSEIHRAVVKGQEGVDSRNQMVGNHGVLFAIQKFLQLPRLKPGLQFQL